jgi:hypothetical protein
MQTKILRISLTDEDQRIETTLEEWLHQGWQIAGVCLDADRQVLIYTLTR